MVRFRRFLLLVVAVLLIPAVASPASVTTVPDCINKSGCYQITGPITADDVVGVKRIVARLRREETLVPMFSLDSPGGDVDAAIQIGTLLREVRAAVVVSLHSQCNSACVFILAGGTQRLVAGTVGIHRPYSPSTTISSYSEAQKHYRDLENKSRDYLLAMNLPSQLFDAMVRVSPEQLKVLGPKELHDYGLDKTDPVEQEIQDSMAAGRYGISKQDYLARKLRVDTECRGQYFERADFQGYALCLNEVMKNLR